MSKKSKDNILVDMYNLKLAENPEQDRDMIIEFFKKYDPKLMEYVDDWFCIEGIKAFYELWHLIKEGIIDNYINKKPTQYFSNLIDDIKPITMMEDMKTGLQFHVNFNLPSFDPKRYKLITIMKTDTYILTTPDGKKESTGKDFLSFGMLKYNLYNAILLLLNGEIVIKKCNALDCENVYIPTPRGRNQEFCSDRCYKRTYTRERRKKIKDSVFV